jgi:hypothetical protein
MHLIISLSFLLMSMNVFSFQILDRAGENHFIKIEFYSKNVSVHCSPVDPNDKNSFTYIYARTPLKIYQFINRRPWSNKTCQFRKRETQKVIDSSSRVIVSGERGDETQEVLKEKDDQNISPPQSKTGRLSTWIFRNIKSKKICFSYFTRDCPDADRNYEP